MILDLALFTFGATLAFLLFLLIPAIIVKRGAKYVLLSRDGKVLGTHDTRAGAAAQERAIKAREAMASRRGRTR